MHNQTYSQKASSSSDGTDLNLGVNKGCPGILHTRTRFLMMVLCLLCLASIWSNILCFNFAILCIDSNDSNGDPSAEDVEVLTAKASKAPLFTSIQRAYFTSAAAAAALAANFPVVSLVNSYGIRIPFASLGILSAISTSLLPIAINQGFYYVLVCRLLQGLSFSANFPIIGAFTSKWSYHKQNGLFVSALVAYVQLAPAISMPVSGALCSTRWGWPSVFYSHGIVSAILFVLFGVCFRNNPAKHPLVCEAEMRKIRIDKSPKSKEFQRKVPLAAILRTGAVWAIWIAAIGNFVCVNMMFLYLPRYLNLVLHFPVAHSGFTASLAPFAQFCLKLIAGFSSDKIHFLSETNKLRLYNSVAFLGSAFFLMLLALCPAEFPLISVGLLGISAGFLGVTTGGFFKAGLLVAKQYALVVMGQISLAVNLTLLFVPVMIHAIAEHNTAEEWRWVFLITAGILAITNLTFCLLISAKPAEWTAESFLSESLNKEIYTVKNENDTKTKTYVYFPQFDVWSSTTTITVDEYF